MHRPIGRYLAAALVVLLTVTATFFIESDAPPIDPVKLSLRTAAEQRATIEALGEAWSNRRTTDDQVGARHERAFLNRVAIVVRSTRGGDRATYSAACRLWNIACSEHARRFKDFPEQE